MVDAHRSFVAVCVAIATALTIAAPARSTAVDFDAETVFRSRCAACHTVGQGDAIGPDLAGITARRDRTWLMSFIRSSQTMIQDGDPVASELFERFGRTKMPDHPYGDEEIAALLDLVARGGVVSAPPLRLADSASAEEIADGKTLFASGAAGTAACTACHTVGPPAASDALYLGGSLRETFSRFFDRELHAVLVTSDVMCRRTLDADESFLIRSYLRSVGSDGESTHPPPALFPFLAFGATFLLVGASRKVSRHVVRGTS